MTSSKDPAGGPPGQRGRRRPPTIELTATEIENAPATAPQAPAPEAEPPRPPEPAPPEPPAQAAPRRASRYKRSSSIGL